MKYFVLFALVACSPDSTNYRLQETSYKLELNKCKESGKDAGSYEVYEQCAKKVDEKFGVKP